MARRSRTCYLCGAKYEYCPTCAQDRMKPIWMSEFHSENCKNIFKICTDFNLGLLTKQETRKSLKRCDLSNQGSFKEYVQQDISKILKNDRNQKSVNE